MHETVAGNFNILAILRISLPDAVAPSAAETFAGKTLSFQYDVVVANGNWLHLRGSKCGCRT